MFDYENFGEYVKECRFKRGMTLAEASELLGLTKVELSNIESGRNKPNAKNFSKIVTAFEMDEDEACKLLRKKNKQQ